MPFVEVLITFNNTEVGSVQCKILGAHTSFEFDVTALDPVIPHPFNLRPNVYSIKVIGSSGGKVSLKVTQTDTGDTLVDTSCDPNNIFILQSFAVN